MNCPKCGFMNDNSSKFCVNCGNDMTSNVTQQVNFQRNNDTINTLNNDQSNNFTNQYNNVNLENKFNNANNVNNLNNGINNYSNQQQTNNQVNYNQNNNSSVSFLLSCCSSFSLKSFPLKSMLLINAK